MSAPTADTSSATTSVGLPISGLPDRSNVASVRSSLPVPRRTPNDFKFLSYIGEGSFSTVMLATEITSRQQFAVKICRKDHIRQEKKGEAIMREKHILNILVNNPSPFFVSLYCSFQDEQRLCKFLREQETN